MSTTDYITIGAQGLNRFTERTTKSQLLNCVNNTAVIGWNLSNYSSDHSRSRVVGNGQNQQMIENDLYIQNMFAGIDQPDHLSATGFGGSLYGCTSILIKQTIRTSEQLDQ